MKIKELIKILETSGDSSREVYIPSIENEITANIWYSFDDFWNIELYETLE